MFLIVLLGSHWLMAWKKVEQLDKAVLEEQQKILSAKKEFEDTIKLHKFNVQKVKKDIRQIADE